jgi:hypothetical protein
MSRNIIWDAQLRITGVNGTSATIELKGDRMTTIRELEALFAKGITMAKLVQTESLPEAATGQWQPKVVG